MSISNPTQLVDAYKKSGEFDRLRRELLASFQRGDGMSSFMNRVEDIARQKLESDQRLHYMPPESVHRELTQELDRFPIIERAVADVRMLSDPSFTTGIRSSVQKILREDRGRGQKPQKIVDGNSQPDGSCQPTPSTTEMSTATRKAQLDTDIQRPGSPLNSRSQSPDSMKISTPEPPEPPSVPLQNGIHPISPA